MENFKLSFTDNTTYAGKDLAGFYSNVLLTGVAKESFKLIPNVKSTAKLGKLNLGKILQDADCSFGGQGEGTLSQKTVEAHDVKINLEYCIKTFEANYLGELYRPGNQNDLPTSVEEFLKGQVAKQISNDLEEITWKGSGATNATYFTSERGLEAKLLADGTVIDVTATTLTAANIVAQIGRVYDAMPAAVRQSEDAAIYVSYAAASFYRQALAAASSEMYFMQNHSELSFLGVKIIPCGISTNKMVAAEKANLLLITDLVSDMDELLILPQRTVTGAPVVRMVGGFKFGVDFIYGAEIVYYN